MRQSRFGAAMMWMGAVLLAAAPALAQGQGQGPGFRGGPGGPPGGPATGQGRGGPGGRPQAGPMGGPPGWGPGGMRGPMQFRTVKAAYLGVEATPADPALREQLGLPEGVGLVVEQVDADSPASEAGVKVHDVLHKVDDQLLVNPPQLMALIRSHKPGDTVTLTVIRAAKPTTLTAKLVEKELPPMQGFPRGPGGFGGPMGSGWVRDGGAVFGGEFAGTVILRDNQHDLAISTRDGQRYLVAKDEQGKVLFEGPIATEQQRQAVPEPIRRKLEMLPMLTGRPDFRPFDPGGMGPGPRPGGPGGGPQGMGGGPGGGPGMPPPPPPGENGPPPGGPGPQ